MMKTCIFVFLLAAGLAAYGQVRGQGTGAAATMQGQSAGSMSSATLQPDPYKQPPDRILKWNPKLSSKLATLLPTGMTAEQACSGFKRMGDCGAAIHVSHNLEIPFSDLKKKLTSDDAQPLADIIPLLKPVMNAKKEAKKAENQADRDLWDARVY
jgi:hypothetical protein